MSRFRVLAVDDEPLALEVLRDLLEADAEVDLVGDYGDGKSALEAIRRERPDIVFLDVEMPEMGGLDVARSLTPEEMPAIVYVTAYGQHATQAFDVEALDYVVKPFSDERFHAALARAKRRIRERRLGKLAGKMASLTAELGEPDTTGASADKITENYLTRIPVQLAGRSLIVKTREIVWIESCDYYSRIHTAETSHLVRTSLASFEERLDPRHFVRVHRQAIVRVDDVRAVEPGVKGGREVVLADGTRLGISRSRQRRVEEVLIPR